MNVRCLRQRARDIGFGGIQPWDWRYYAEKVRQAKFNFDESELKPYLSLDSITNAMFDVSNKLSD